MTARRITNWHLFIIVAGLLSLALPLFILLSGSQISDPDIEKFARLHLQPEFWPRVFLTFVYFPAVIAIHFLAQPFRTDLRTLFLIGFSIFLIANGIDAAYRAVQFLTVHGRWASDIIVASDTVVRQAAIERVETFNHLSSSIIASFSSLFGAGRILMGVALILAKGRISRLAGIALIINGIWNLASVAALIPSLAFLSVFGEFYLWIWLFSVALTSTAAWTWAEEVRHGRDVLSQ